MTVTIPTHDKAAHRAWYLQLRNGQVGDRYDSATALRILGLDGIHPADVVASTHPTRRMALLSARANREVFGHPTLGVAPVKGAGWVAVADLRPALAAAGCPPIEVAR